jgi:hypothetical protein
VTTLRRRARLAAIRTARALLSAMEKLAAKVAIIGSGNIVK